MYNNLKQQIAKKWNWAISNLPNSAVIVVE